MNDIAVALGLGTIGLMLAFAVIDNYIIATLLGMGLGLTGFIFLNNWYH